MGKLEKFVLPLFHSSPYLIRQIGLNLYGYFLAYKRFKGNFSAYYEFFQHSQYWSPEALEAFQLKKLREILQIAYYKVPFYRDFFKERGLTLDDIQSFKDLQKIPSVSKAEIRRNPRLFLHQDIDKMGGIVKDYSSGTTGEKFTFYLPKELAYPINYSLTYRFYSWAGVEKGDRRVTIGGRIFTHRPPYWSFNKAENQLLLSIHHLNEATVDLYINIIKEFSPVFIQGQPWGIYFIAERMNNRRLHIPLKAVFTTGETLYDYQRKSIEKAFLCSVYESYGLSECVVAAFECEEHKGFHTSELGIIEFEKQADGLYKVIGTSLWNYAMPFIRYEIEDVVELSETSKCPCGRGLPLQIKRVIGRIDDVLYSTYGLSILPVTLRMHIKPLLHNYESYQVLQVGAKEYQLLLTGEVNEKRISLFRKILLQIFGEDAKISIKSVDKLLSTSGKMRNVINLYRRGP
jgi:phenylacetate-CoA ligase